MVTLMDWILIVIGEVFVAIGIFCDLMAAIGLFRFPNFYLRLHALTVGTIGGAVLPLIGTALIASGCDFLGPYRWFTAGASIIVALLLLILAPAGSHIIARATYRSNTVRPWPTIVDDLAKKMNKIRDVSEGS